MKNIQIMESFPMTVQVLATTGLGFLVTDKGYWSDKVWLKVQSVAITWRTQTNKFKRHPMDGHHVVALKFHERPLARHKTFAVGSQKKMMTMRALRFTKRRLLF